MNKLDVFQQITKSVFILILVSFLLLKVATCVDEYLENPTYTKSKIVDQKEAAFPALTICPINRSIAYNESILNNHGISQANHYFGKTKCSSTIMNWSSNNTAVSENELYDEMTFNFDELVKWIKVMHFNGHRVSHFEFMKLSQAIL